MTPRAWYWLATVVSFLAALLIVLAVTAPRTGWCMACAPIPCTVNSGCNGDGCVCVVAPGEYWGECWGIGE